MSNQKPMRLGEDLAVSILVVGRALLNPSLRGFFYHVATRTGWRVGLVSPRHCDIRTTDESDVPEPLQGRVRIFTTPTLAGPNSTLFFLRIRKIVRRFFIDHIFAGKRNLVICIDQPSSLTALWLWLMTRTPHLAGRRNFFIIYSPTLIEPHPSGYSARIYKYLLGKTDAIAVTSEDQRQALITIGYQKHCMVLPPWIDSENFYFQERQSAINILKSCGEDFTFEDRISLGVEISPDDPSRIEFVLKELLPWHQQIQILCLYTPHDATTHNLLAQPFTEFSIPVSVFSVRSPESRNAFYNCCDIFITDSMLVEYHEAAACGVLIVQSQNVNESLQQIQSEKLESRLENRQLRSRGILKKYATDVAAGRFSQDLFALID